MPSEPTLPCINPNPDISGIGVRVAIYVQAILTYLPSLLSILDGKITPEEYHTLLTTNTNLLVTACALLISSIIQAKTYGLSAYHAVIVLNLSWINNTSAVSYMVVDDSQPPNIQDASNRSRFSAFCRRVYIRSDGKPNWPILLATMHYCGMASVGFWLWSSPREFGSQPECISQTSVTLFWHDIPMTNRSLRIFSLIIYTLAIFPIINVFLACIIAFIGGFILLQFATLIFRIMHFVWRRCPSPTTWFDPRDNLRPIQIATLVGVATAVVLFIANTELMIKRNKDIVRPGESEWTFGQTLAMFLVALPALDLIKQVWKSYGGEHVTSSRGVELGQSPAK